MRDVQKKSASPGKPRTGSEIQVEGPSELEEPWTTVRRVAFRLCFTYLGLYALATQISGSLFVIPLVPYRGLGLLWPMRDITFWIGERIFHLPLPLEYTGNSRD